MANVRLIKHEVIPDCGSFEIRFPDGRPSRYFYWDDLPSRRLRPDLVDSGDGAGAGQGVCEGRAGGA